MYDEQHGTLTLAELWRQHNEHRMVVPSIFVLALAKLGGWNLIREEIVSVALCALGQIVLWRLVRGTLPAAAVPAAFLAMSLSLWNLGQAENFAMGLQMGWLFIELCVLIVVWRLCAARRTPLDIVIAGVSASLASYCSEIGLLAWPVGLCAIILRRDRRRRTAAIWVAWAAGAYAVFRIGYVDGGVGHVPIVSNLGGLLLYSLAYLGVPLAFWAGLWGCVLAGIALLLILGALVAQDILNVPKTNRRSAHDATPWYALASFAILGAIATGPNRLGLGLDGVVTSTRYILVSSWLTTAVIGLLAQRYPLRLRLPSSRTTPATALIVVLALATAVSWLRGLRDWQHFSAARLADVRALRSGELAHVAPYYVHREILRSDVDELRALRDGPLRP